MGDVLARAGLGIEMSSRKPQEFELRLAANAIPAAHGEAEATAPADQGHSAVSWARQPLYGKFYSVGEPPFDLTPNPRFLFLSTRQREALSNLRYALASSRGFTLILGEAGTGKTTLV